MAIPLHVLIAEDEPDDAELMVLRLVEEGFKPDWQRVQNEKDYLRALKANPDLILADWRMPHFSGLRALQLMNERGLDIPFIIVSGSIGEETAVDALRQGADDYVLKDRPARLGQAVRHALEDKRARQERKRAEEALRESEEKYRSLVERANDGITIIQDGVVKFANTRLVKMWGGTVEEVLETPFANLIHPDQLPAMVERYQQRMAGEDIPPMYETVLLCSDGSKVHVEINAGVIAYLGKPADLVVVRDVTERKQAEEALRQRAEELAALQATVLEITAPHDLPNSLQTIVERAVNLLNANGGGLYLCNPEQQEVRCLVSYKTPRDYTGTVLKYGQGAAGTVAQTGKPLIIDDYRNWGKRADAFEKEQPFSAVLSVPMLWQGQVTGVIHVLHTVETRRFTQADQELLSLFAHHASIAVENARLLQGLQTERDQAQQYLDIAGVMMTALDSNGRITLVNKKGCEILGYENEQELIGRDWFETCLPPRIKEDAKKVIDQLMAGDISPVEYHENPVLTKAGQERVIAFHNTVIHDAALNITGILFSGEDITERKRAEAQIRQRNIELAAVNRIGQAFSQLRPPSEIVELLYTHIGQVLDNRNLYIALCDEAHQTLSFPVYTINGERHTPASRPFGNGLTEYVIRTGAPLLIPRNQPAFHAEQGIDLIGTPSKCFLAAPMRVGERVTGVIAVQDYENEDIYDANHVELIDTLAAQAAIALENARLYEQAQQEIAERKQVEETLQQSAANLKEAQRIGRLGSWDWDTTTDTITWSEEYYRMIGVDPKQRPFGYEEHLKDYTPESAARLVAAVMHSVQTGEGYQLDLELARADGTRRWITARGEVKRDANGQIVGFRGTAQDITERKRVEKELQALSSLNEAILASVPDIIMEVDNNKVYTWANHAGIEFFGEGVVGKEADSFFEGEQEIYDVVQPLFNGSEDIIYVESWQRRHDGEKRLLAWWCRVLKDAEGNITGALSTAHDITERKRAEEAAEEERNLLRTLIDNLPDYIYVKDPKGQFVLGNTAVAHQMGFSSPDELVGKSDFDLFPHEIAVQYQALEQEIIQSGRGVYSYEGPTVDSSKEEENRWVSTTKVPLRDAQGKVVGFVGLGRDITERKQMADELRQRYDELALLYEAGLTINRELDPHLQLETLFKTAMQALQADHAEFFRYDAAKDSLQFELGIGYSPEVLDKLHGLVAHNGEAQGLIGLIAQNHQPLNLPDVHADPRYVAVDPEIRSALWVPVARENQLLGVLGVLSTRPNAFSDQHERLLSLFANQAAVALENARLFAETSRRLRQVQALRTIDMAISSSLDLRVTLDIFLEQATWQLEVHAADILLLNPHTQTLEYIAGRGFRTNVLQQTHLRLGEGYAGMAGLERKIIHISDLRNRKTDLLRSPFFSSEEFETCFCVPLIAKGQLKGVLEIFHRAPLEANQEWLDFVETLAGQAAIAVDNITLFDDLQRSNVELTLAYDATIEGWSHALDLRDKETEGHTQRVTEMTLRLARAMGVSDTEMVHIRRGALLHDIGKMGIPDEILHKPGPLSEKEWTIMRQHPVFAYEMLLPISYLRPAMYIPYCHHEKWDGSGYPRGLKGEQIPLAARLFAVVDVYDALTSDRPYRNAWSCQEALEYIQQQAGLHFDPVIVNAFMGMPGLHE